MRRVMGDRRPYCFRRAGSETRVGVAVVIAAALVGAAVAWRWRPRRVRVNGLSMTPALLPGDRLLVLPAGRVTPGDLVVVRDPTAPRRLVVKRVVAHRADGIDVRGDNAGASTDSRHWGPVPATAIAGRAVYCYAPPQRSGRLRAR